MESLGINVKVLIVQAVNFFLLFGVLSWFLYKPVLKLFADREKKIKESLSAAERAQKDSEELNKNIANKMEEAKKEAKKILDDAKVQSEKERQEIVVKTQKETEEIVKLAKDQIKLDKESLKQELRKEVVDLTILSTSKLLKKELTGAEQEKFIEETLNNLK